MTAIEMRAELLREINPIFDDMSLMQEVISFVKGLTLKKRKAIAAECASECDTDEEIEDNLRQAFNEFKEYKSGKRKFKTADEFLKELESYE